MEMSVGGILRVIVQKSSVSKSWVLTTRKWLLQHCLNPDFWCLLPDLESGQGIQAYYVGQKTFGVQIFDAGQDECSCLVQYLQLKGQLLYVLHLPLLDSPSVAKRKIKQFTSARKPYGHPMVSPRCSSWFLFLSPPPICQSQGTQAQI